MLRYVIILLLFVWQAFNNEISRNIIGQNEQIQVKSKIFVPTQIEDSYKVTKTLQSTNNNEKNLQKKGHDYFVNKLTQNIKRQPIKDSQKELSTNKQAQKISPKTQDKQILIKTLNYAKLQEIKSSYNAVSQLFKPQKIDDKFKTNVPKDKFVKTKQSGVQNTQKPKIQEQPNNKINSQIKSAIQWKINKEYPVVKIHDYQNLPNSQNEKIPRNSNRHQQTTANQNIPSQTTRPIQAIPQKTTPQATEKPTQSKHTIQANRLHLPYEKQQKWVLMRNLTKIRTKLAENSVSILLIFTSVIIFYCFNQQKETKLIKKYKKVVQSEQEIEKQQLSDSDEE